MALSALPVVREEELTLPPPAKRFSNQLASAVRSIGWSYAIYWSISTNCPGVLTWKDGFYNGEVKTRKITSSTDLTAGDQPVLQRSEQLRELYESLLSGECDHRARRPVGSLSPEDLGETEWYYTVSMTYTFRPGQDLPGKSLASNEHVWLCNAQSADTKTFSRVLLAKTASIQTVVCIPLMGGVLELGTTDPVSEDSELVSWISTAFWELQFPTCSERAISSSPSANETGEAADIVFDDLDHNSIGTIELGEIEVGCLPDVNLERITAEIDGFYSLSEELDVRAMVEDDLIVTDGWSFEVYTTTSPLEEPVGVGASTANDVVAVTLGSRSLLEGSLSSCFTAWKRSWDFDDVDVAPVTGESQKLLKKVVAGGAWSSNGGEAHRESSTRNHVMSERRRREKLNEMFLTLKSLVPSIMGKVDKASILAETITYLKELEKRVVELKSIREQPSHPAAEKTIGRKRHDVAGRKVVSAEDKRKASELGVCADVGRERRWEILSRNDGPSNVNVTVMDKEVLLEVQCRWKELMMTLVFDAIKRLRLDVVSVQASTPDGLLVLKIRAQFAGSAVVAPGMISEALQKAIGGKR